MEISSNPAAQLGAAVGTAIQKQVLDEMRTQGAEVINLIASGSASSPTQGRNVDALA